MKRASMPQAGPTRHALLPAASQGCPNCRAGGDTNNAWVSPESPSAPRRDWAVQQANFRGNPEATPRQALTLGRALATAPDTSPRDYGMITGHDDI